MSLHEHAEYMALVIRNKSELDPQSLCKSLHNYLTQTISRQHSNKVRTASITCIATAGYLAFSVAIGRRQLIAYQQTAAKRGMFLEIVLQSMMFLRFYEIKPLIVCYSDQIGWSQSLLRCIKSHLPDIDRRRMEPGVAIELADLHSFYWSRVEAQLSSPMHLQAQNVQVDRFFVSSVTFADTIQEVEPLIHRQLACDEFSICRVETLDEVAPAIEIPQFETSGFDWDCPRVIFTTGRTYFTDN